MIRTLVLCSLLLLAVPAIAQEIVLETVATGLDNVVSIAHAGDARLFLVEQRGRIKIWSGTQVLPALFLDISSLVSCCGERGLLGLAFHPRYSENGFFYVNYTDTGGDTVIARYSVSEADPNRATAASAQVLMRVDQPFPNHNGGQLAFGPDGYLYIGLGDGGSGGDPGNRAQNMTELLGKMLRIDVDSGSPYGIPPSNPFINTPNTRPEIWASGLRNPWRYSFDRLGGDLWIADVGQGNWEEINHQPATSIGGEDYGWKCMEGTHVFTTSVNCGTPLVAPVIEYNHSAGACSVTGGYVYRGARYPLLHGTYIYGDFCNGIIWGATRNNSGGFTSRTLLDTSLLISTFGEDVSGEVYVVNWTTGGTMYRITDPRPLPAKRRVVSKPR